MEKKNYIQHLREKVGHEPVILVFAGGILTNDRDEILLQKRSDFNLWGLPGGALEFGEDAVAACKREFMEETGINIEVDKLLGVSTNNIQNYPNGDVAQSVVIDFLVSSIGKEVTTLSSETLNLQYFSKNNLPKIFNQQHQTAINNYYSKKYPYFE